MKLITRDTDYAIRAFCCIAGLKEKTVTVKELAERLDIPGPFLRKILQVLNKKGLLSSFKGKGGGFSIAVDPREVTILDLLEIFQGSFRLSEHVFKGKMCPEIKTCLLKRRLDRIEKKTVKELSDIKISSLLRR